eukprot:Seg2531.3 transcript_id=Seg2531.3/GoldUCD/mRNA.D3Y31 product="hypothetical protein" protein_id=Seg2531.3/GoldUCD/D3Y31
MSSKKSVANAVLESMMNKRERIISMGYLAKSPSKSKDKAKHTMFWKLRWCVFAEVTYTDAFTFAEDSKLILYYYEDRDSHKRDVNSKGHLDISDCISINSCYESQAGFDHIFTIRCPYGKFVKFSASSCRKKFIWLDILFRNKFNTNVQGVVRSKVISQSSKISRPGEMRSFDDLSGNVGTSTSQYASHGKARSVSLRQPVKKFVISPRGSSLKAIRTDSGTFSMSTVSSVSSDDEPPPLPPPRRRPSQESLPSLFEDQRSLCSEFSDLGSSTQEWEARFPSREPSFSGGIGQRSASLGSKVQTVDSAIDEYFYCERCEKEAKKKRGSLTRRMSSKKRSGLKDDQHTHVEVEDTSIQPTIPATDYLLNDSFDSDELVIDENEKKQDQIYVEIDDEWLDKVRRMTGSTIRVEPMNQAEIGTDKPDGNAPFASANEDFPEDDMYQPMNLYTREYTPPLDQVETDLRENALSRLERPRLRHCYEEDEYLVGEGVNKWGGEGSGFNCEATNNSDDSDVNEADLDENIFTNQCLGDREKEASDTNYDDETRNNIDNEINEVVMEKKVDNLQEGYHGIEATNQGCDNEAANGKGEEAKYQRISDHKIVDSGPGCNDEASNSNNLGISKAELIGTEKWDTEAGESHLHNNEIKRSFATIKEATDPLRSDPRTDGDEVSKLGLNETETITKGEVFARENHLHNNEIVGSSETIKKAVVPQNSEPGIDGDEVGKFDLNQTETVIKGDVVAGESHLHNNEIIRSSATIKRVVVPQNSEPGIDRDEVSTLDLNETDRVSEGDVFPGESHLREEIMRSSATIKKAVVSQKWESGVDGDHFDDEEDICLDSYLQGLNNNKQRFHGRVDLSGISEHYDTAL